MDSIFLEPSSETLDKKLHQVIAGGEDRELMDEFQKLAELIEGLRTSAEDRLDVDLAITNAGAAAAIALRRGKPGLLRVALEGMVETYRLGDIKTDSPGDDDTRLFESAAGSLWALGAVAIEARDYEGLREIIIPRPSDDGYYATWLRHGQVMSARGATDPADDNVLDLAERKLRRHVGFGMVRASDDERLRTLCQFDQLALLTVAGLAPDSRTNFYPSYAKYPVEYVEDAVIALRGQGPLRTAVFPHSDDKLRPLLSETNEMALFQAAQNRYHGGQWKYIGFQDPRTWMFIRDGGLWETWAQVSRSL